MKNLNLLDIYRLKTRAILQAYGTFGDETCGMFSIPSPKGGSLLIVASCGDGWDHVSISRDDRIPDWEEMSYIKELFFLEKEYAFQLHVPKGSHINLAKFCLHLWRPNDGREIPIPPTYLVGPA